MIIWHNKTVQLTDISVRPLVKTTGVVCLTAVSADPMKKSISLHVVTTSFSQQHNFYNRCLVTRWVYCIITAEMSRGAQFIAYNEIHIDRSISKVLCSVVVKLWSRAAVLTYFLRIACCGFSRAEDWILSHCLVLKKQEVKENITCQSGAIWCGTTCCFC